MRGDQNRADSWPNFLAGIIAEMMAVAGLLAVAIVVSRLVTL
jgi:hypothetical protein